LAQVYYGFGDASQDGFGFNMQEQKGDTVHYLFGQWCDSISEKSSNYRELCNLVEGLEELVADGTLNGCEIFIFTDNTTMETVFYKGNSSSMHLYELVLRELEMCGNLKLHMLIHVVR
jgi:ribonuclease HI